MKRYDLVDTLRGLSVIGMIGFHACWIMSYFGIAISSQTLFGPLFTAWERSICISFIVIAGFSFLYGRHHLRAAIVMFSIGAAISVITCIFLPDIRIVFGILTFLGTATFLMIPVDLFIRKIGSDSRIPYLICLLLCLLLFVMSYNINLGTLGIPGLLSTQLPEYLYKGYVATFIGFKDPYFYSTDYFSLLPWFFVYLCGYFLHRFIKGTDFENRVMTKGIPVIRSVGRHSLSIYLIHPVVLFVFFYFWAN